jgi:ABC-type sugar transport system ATPase subunit
MIAHQISEVFDLSTQTLVFSQGRLTSWEKLTGKTSNDISSDEFRRWTYDYYSKATASPPH